MQRAIAEPAALGDWCARPQSHSVAGLTPWMPRSLA
jgi:hypothetical protein